jgi:hypothetical protein
MPASAQDTIMFQGTAICVFSHQEAATFSFVNATKKVTRPSGDFNTNYSAGQFFRPEGAVANLKRCFQIVSVDVDGLGMVLDAAPAEEASVACTLKVFDPAALMTDFDGPQQDNPEVDVTHSLSNAREFKPGLVNNGTFSFNGNTVRGDEGYQTLLGMQVARSSAEFLIAGSDRLGFKEFLGSIATISEAGSLDDKVGFSASVRISGAIVNSELLS